MTTISAFSKYLAYDVGGAETSTRSLLKQEATKGSKINIISVENAQFLGKVIPEAELSSSWSKSFIEQKVRLSRFSYLEYLLNRSLLINWFSKLSTDELWTYGIWAPAAMIGYSGKIKYFIRSETDLGIIGNYHNGVKRWIKKAYSFAEYPAIKMYRSDLKSTIKNVSVITNSNYMKKRAGECFGIDSEVWYPPVDVSHIHSHLVESKLDSRWIVFVGDSVYKGFNLVLEMAKRLPALSFRIFSRAIKNEYQDGNILWSPWQLETWLIYEGARLVIVPSQWEEAFGRVAREAKLLALPVLVSNIGGLPEAVNQDESCLVDEYWDVQAWCNKINELLKF